MLDYTNESMFRPILIAVFFIVVQYSEAQISVHSKTQSLEILKKARIETDEDKKAEYYVESVRNLRKFPRDSAQLILSEAQDFIRNRTIKDVHYVNIEKIGIRYHASSTTRAQRISLFKNLIPYVGLTDTLNRFAINYAIGSNYQVETQFDSALHYLNQAKIAAVEMNDSLKLGRIVSGKAGCYLKISREKQALELMESFIGNKALSQFDLHVLGTYSWCHATMGNQEKVVEIYNAAVDKHGQDKVASAATSLITYYCGALVNTKQFELAEDVLAKHIQFYKDKGRTKLLSGLYQYYSSVLKRTGRKKEALEAMDSTYHYRRDRLSLTFLSRYHRQKSILYLQLNQNDSALRHFYKFEKYLNKHYKTNAEEEYAKTVIQLETQEKENEIVLLQKENELERSKSWRLKLMLAFVALLLIAGAVVLYQYFRQRRVKAKQELVQAELTSIRSQMNPHFMFNALNSVKSYIIKNDSHTAARYLGKFASLMRGILNLSSEPFVSLQEELEVLQLYIEMEQLRFKNKFEYHLDLANEIDTENLLVTPLFLQPFIENAIKHGLTPLEERVGKLDVRIMQNNGVLTFEITDNGIGRDPKKAKSGHKSKGMQLSKQRIAMLNQDLIDHDHIIIDDLTNENGKPCGTRVTINLVPKPKY